MTASPMPGADGAPDGVVVSFEDVTEGRKLRLESRRFSMMIEQAAQGIAATDMNGNITFANATMAALHGYQPTELIGKHLKTLYAPGQVTTQEAFLELVRRNGYHTGEVMHVRKDGTTFRAELKVSLLKEGSSQPIGMVVFVLDVTQRKLAEVELKAAKELAEAASRAKSEFLANMSHEIRTPMNGVIGMTELLLDTTLTREQREYLEALKGSADSLLTLLNDILDFSKIEAGRLELEPIEFSLRSSISETLKTLAVRAHAKGLELIYHVEPDVPDSLIGDAGRLRQILVNLVGNAIKFTERGEVALHVNLEAAARRGRAAAVRRLRHRHRHPGGQAGAHLRRLLPGRQLDHAQVRRHRPRPGDLLAARHDDGRPHLGREPFAAALAAGRAGHRFPFQPPVRARLRRRAPPRP